MRHCIDIDECEERRKTNLDSPICGPVGSKCLNIAGSFTCYCPRGYKSTQDGKSCVDIDECKEESNKCGVYGKCINTSGGFNCQCESGFILAPSGTECIHAQVESCWRACNPIFSVETTTAGTVGEGKPIHVINPSEEPVYNYQYDYEFLSEYEKTETVQAFRSDSEPTNGPIVIPELNTVVHKASTTRSLNSMTHNFMCDYQIRSTTKPSCCCQCLDNAWGKDENSRGLCPEQGSEEFKKLCPKGCGVSVDLTGEDEDLNECDLNPDNSFCPQGTCVNRDGSYRCECNKGFILAEKNICVDVDECATNSNICGPHADHTKGNNGCINTSGSYKCICQEGYRPSHQTPYCVDIDECAYGGTASCRHRCENTPGGYKCHCPRGFQVVANSNSNNLNSADTCENINECEIQPNICDKNMECIDTIGSYRCECKPGTEKIGDQCVDIDECNSLANIMPCGRKGVCSNILNNFYECSCTGGYTQSLDKMSCEDNRIGTCFLKYHARYGLIASANFDTNIRKDECCCSVGQGWIANTFSSTPTENVDNVDKCPTYGSIEWQELCPFGKGYNKHGHDINDCEIIPHACNGVDRPNAGNCINQSPSYQCICRPGFQLTSDGKDCVDIDECSVPHLNRCTSHSTCVNTMGSYSCQCEAGYELKGETLCVDIDECSHMRGDPKGHNCQDICINTQGSFECACPGGYQLIGKYYFVLVFLEPFFQHRNKTIFYLYLFLR